MNDLIVRTTAGVCIGLYLIACLLLRRRSPAASPDGCVAAAPSWAARWCWTAAWGMLVVHTAAAFEFRHEWSHALASDHVAKRTQEVVGFYWAGGVWFNYVLLLVWGADVALTWRGIAPRRWTMFVHAFLAMLVASATVVFGPAYWWIAAVVFAAAVFAIRPQRPAGEDSSKPDAPAKESAE